MISQGRRHRLLVANQRGAEEVRLLAVLVEGVDGGDVGDLLAVVGCVEQELIVVDSDFLVWIGGEEGELNVGVEGGGGGEVELSDVSVFEGEVGF